MKKFEYTITDELGIHARPAGMLAKEVQKYKSKITLTKNDKTVEMARLIGVMSMGIKHGETVTVEIEGEDEDTAAAEIEEFFKQNL